MSTLWCEEQAGKEHGVLDWLTQSRAVLGGPFPSSSLGFPYHKYASHQCIVSHEDVLAALLSSPVFHKRHQAPVEARQWQVW